MNSRKALSEWNRRLTSAYDNLTIHQQVMHDQKFPFEQREVARNTFYRTRVYIELLEFTIKELLKGVVENEKNQT